MILVHIYADSPKAVKARVFVMCNVRYSLACHAIFSSDGRSMFLAHRINLRSMSALAAICITYG